MNKRMLDALRHVANELELRIVAPFGIRLPSGLELTAEALFPDFGAPNGTVVIESRSRVAGVGSELKKLHYTLSSFRAPLEGQEVNIQSYADMFREWGWSSGERQPPSWLSE